MTKILNIGLQSAIGLQRQVWITNYDRVTKPDRLQSDTVHGRKRHFLRKDLILLLISIKDGEKNSELVR